MEPSNGSGGDCRVAALSGGSSGIGKAIAAAFCARGWKVALGARRVERVRETVDSLREAGGAVFGDTLDVTDAGSIDAFYDAARETLGPIDLVVSCAAHARPGPFWELPPEEIRSEIDTGLIGALLFARRGVRDMIAARSRGDVVFISSTTAAVPWPFHSPYAASKAGLEQASRSIALELEGTGIRSLVVRVGNTVGTGWANDWQAQDLGVTRRWQQLGLIRHGGFMQPAQVAEAVIAVVTTPRGVQLEHVTVHPEAPMAEPAED
ncbi:MAG: SDR family NAD(P)-dependent oxidoreductase [Deltaproteobacteria bacterium]|nr:SDR family NAD(P)-dependent oxidoreductase [Deltaproteobacteria bacterium]